MMDLVEHDERRASQMVREQVGRRRDLLIGHDDAIQLRPPCTVRIAPPRIEMNADQIRGVRPLSAKRHRRADDDRLSAACRTDRVAGGEGLSGARGRDEQEVRTRGRRVRSQELRLPPSWRNSHGERPPLTRLQRGQRALPFAGSVTPPAPCGVT
jgi:hypothetical protein